MPRGRPRKMEQESPVAPIESVKSENPCWNCGSQMTGDRCEECGFDKSLLYNLELEADKAHKRQLSKPGE